MLKALLFSILFVVITIIMFGCKSVEKTRIGTITYPDGRVETYEATTRDDSFTLGGSEGESKVLNFPLSNLDISGASL